MFLDDAAVMHFMKCAPNSTIAGARIARYLAGRVNAKLIDSEGCALPSRIKTLFIVNSPFAFCSFRALAEEAVRRAETIVWIENDYKIDVPTQVKKALGERKMRRWTIIAQRAKDAGDEFVPWNKLTWKELPLAKPTQAGLFYYGAFREGRAKDFVTYLANAPYSVHVCCSKKAQPKFLDTCPGAKIYNPWQTTRSFQRFQAGLYIEDDYSHDINTTPANRFYEMLSAGLPMLFDEKCLHFFSENGYPEVDQFKVASQADVEAALERSGEIQARQRELWARDYRGELNGAVDAAVERLAK